MALTQELAMKLTDAIPRIDFGLASLAVGS